MAASRVRLAWLSHNHPSVWGIHRPTYSWTPRCVPVAPGPGTRSPSTASNSASAFPRSTKNTVIRSSSKSSSRSGLESAPNLVLRAAQVSRARRLIKGHGAMGKTRTGGVPGSPTPGDGSGIRGCWLRRSLKTSTTKYAGASLRLIPACVNTWRARSFTKSRWHRAAQQSVAECRILNCGDALTECRSAGALSKGPWAVHHFRKAPTPNPSTLRIPREFLGG